MGGPLLEEVFKTNGVPTYTFVKPKEWERLLVALRTPGRSIVIEGPSGIGKTSAVETALKELRLPVSAKLSARRVDDIEYIEALPTINDAGIVIVDDFHKLPETVRRTLADYMKSLADVENPRTKLVIIGINNAGESLIAFASDLVNRLEIIAFESNPGPKVFELITKGEQVLNITLNVKEDIRDASNGSFYIAQMLCHHVVLRAGVMECCGETKAIEESFEAVKAEVCNRLGLSFRQRCQKFCQGSKMRPEGRAPYLHLLYWLSQDPGWTLHLQLAIRQHPELKGSVGQVVEKGYLRDLICNDPEIAAVLHFDPVARLLTAEDPQFMFYIRNIPWLEFSRELGFQAVEFTNRYDFALSFAGADRAVAKALHDSLVEEEVEVFYDRNEQHRIMAEDIEDYLRPIYQTEARFVVCLLGPEFPKRIWTNFESQSFRERFKYGAVIPIWFSNSPPGAFDESRRVGGFTLEMEKDLTSQISDLKRLLLKKLSDARIDDATP